MREQLMNQFVVNVKTEAKYHEGSDSELRHSGGVEVQHGGVRILRDLAEHFVPGLCPQFRCLVVALDLHPLYHHALESEQSLQHASQSHLHDYYLQRINILLAYNHNIY